MLTKQRVVFLLIICIMVSFGLVTVARSDGEDSAGGGIAMPTDAETFQMTLDTALQTEIDNALEGLDSDIPDDVRDDIDKYVKKEVRDKAMKEYERLKNEADKSKLKRTVLRIIKEARVKAKKLALEQVESENSSVGWQLQPMPPVIASGGGMAVPGNFAQALEAIAPLNFSHGLEIGGYPPSGNDTEWIDYALTGVPPGFSTDTPQIFNDPQKTLIRNCVINGIWGDALWLDPSSTNPTAVQLQSTVDFYTQQ